MRKLLFTLAATFSLGACATAPADDAPTMAEAPAAAAPQSELAGLVSQVNIPYQSFTLDNGLRVVVHEDRKAPVVAVSVWYNVGSKDEPAGRTGFAHLFEHMMFYGSENAPGDLFQRLEGIGATDWNGTTFFDRTNYFETVPTAALETALFIESDRMGHLLGAVTEEKLRNQIGVVQNEKRQGDNEPFGLVSYRQLERLLPEGHPYRHSPIGSMADLDAATLRTVHEWFRENYGPNNAVLVLAGDIDVATARTLVTRYFGDIPRGPVNEPARADVPTLPARIDDTMTDRVATTRLYRSWVVPGGGHDDLVDLQIAAGALGGLSSSRLDNILVRGEQSAVRVSANVQELHRISFFDVEVDVRPGVDADQVSRRLDQIIAEFVANGPTEDEVRRVAMRSVSGRIQGLEQVGGFGGKAVALAEGMLYHDNPNHYREQLDALARTTPGEVRAATQRWLARPVYALRVNPGEREAYQEAQGVRPTAAASGVPAGAGNSVGEMRPLYFRTPEPGEQPLARRPLSAVQVDRSRIPEPGIGGQLDFPDVQRATLSNGMRVAFARRTTVPVVRTSIQFDAGYAADPEGREGLQSLMASLLDEGTTSRNSTQIAEEQERLGADLQVGASLDRTAVHLTALRTNMPAALDLMADVIKNPAFAPAELERLRQQRLAQIAGELTQPNGIALRTLPPLLYGRDHPYGVPFTGSGTAAAAQAISRDDVVRAHQSWIRPDKAEIFVVGDITLEELMPMLETRFGNWTPPALAAGTKDFSRPIPASASRIILIDRPQSPQSMILAGQVLPGRGTDDLLPFLAANEVLGGATAARLNQDLRETRGWAYGAFSFVNRAEYQSPLIVFAPVQTDRTGESIAALRGQLRDFTTSRGVQPAELQRVVQGNIRGLPGSYETGQAVIGAMIENSVFDRPDNYQETIAGRYQGLTAAELDRVARASIDPSRVVWVVVGDAAQVRPQLERLGLPIEVMQLQ